MKRTANSYCLIVPKYKNGGASYQTPPFSFTPYSSGNGVLLIFLFGQTFSLGLPVGVGGGLDGGEVCAGAFM